MCTINKNKIIDFFRNIIVGIALSIIMLNLGAALGILSGRGAFAGMLSAGLIAIITSAFGGTRIQGSGLTAPMSTVTALVVAFSLEQLPQEISGISADHFVNIVLMLTALLMFVFGLLKIGRFISYVPTLVISGFMCGIAMIIWFLQINLLIGFNTTPIQGNVIMNISIALATFIIAFVTPLFFKQFSSPVFRFLPGSLIALIGVSYTAYVLQLPVEYLNIQTHAKSLDSLKTLIASQIPTVISWEVIMLALPFSFKLAALCYIDTLLTSLIIDKMRGETSRRNKELMAQGTAVAAVSLIGGVPGAQSTVPSILTLKEGATSRIAGIAAGCFVIIGVLLLADLMNNIPKAVFCGILLKVGYDIFDFKPFSAYMRTLKRSFGKRTSRIMGHKEMTVMSGTALITAFVDLIAAVGIFTFAYHFFNKLNQKHRLLFDYVPK